MQTRSLLHILVAFAATTPFVACADDDKDQDTQAGDGDGDSETAGDGDGEPGDGDGEPGDGDGEPGDGDGEPGDGDGDGNANACQSAADAIAPEFVDDKCTTILRFSYESLEPISYDLHCGKSPESPLTEEMARTLSDCCKDGSLLSADQDGLFLFYTAPAEDKGGMTLVSNHLADRSLEATIRPGAGGDYTHPLTWTDAAVLGNACSAPVPAAVGYDLGNEGMPIDAMNQDRLLQAFTKTALPDAITTAGGTIQRVIALSYPRVSEPGNEDKAEYVLVVESGK